MRVYEIVLMPPGPPMILIKSNYSIWPPYREKGGIFFFIFLLMIFLHFSPPQQEALWEALKSRDIDLVISDHSPCTVDLKLLDRGDFMAAWGGIAGVQYGR